jgi:hypothetical protein
VSAAKRAIAELEAAGYMAYGVEPDAVTRWAALAHLAVLTPDEAATLLKWEAAVSAETMSSDDDVERALITKLKRIAGDS